MKPKTIVPLVIGLAVGFFAIKMGVDMVNKAKGNQEARRTVLVASRMIDTAALVTDVMYTAKEVPASLVPADAFTDPKQLEGRVTKMPIPANVPITRNMLAPPGSEPGLGAKIPAGFRAVSVAVNEETAVGGFLTPGCRVDVYSLVANSQEADSRLILSNVEVGAVGQSLSQVGPDGKTVNIAKSVTLFLRPEQVQVLNAATGGRGKGKVRLAMRGHGDETGDENLFSRLASAWMTQPKPEPIVIEPQKKPEPQAPRLHIVQVRRGEEVERLVFDESGTLHQADGDSPVPTKAVPSGMSDTADPQDVDIEEPTEIYE